MPKIKSHRGAAKRFKKTASGKFKAHHGFASHILGKKTRKRKRNLRKAITAHEANVSQLRRMLPY